MGLIKAFTGALGGTLADQWKDIITADDFDEHVVIAPGVFVASNNGRSSNFKGSAAVVTNGSKIYIPENTAAVIFNQGGIEEVVSEAGGYEYQAGQASIFGGTKMAKSIEDQTKERFGYGGQSPDNKEIAFVNLREIRGIKFGTKGPQTYHDLFYGVDLEILSFGAFSIKVTDPIRFIREFVPVTTGYYSFDDGKARSQLLSEFLQSFTLVLNSLSEQYRISQLPAHSSEIVGKIAQSRSLVGDWQERFGIKLVSIGIENIEFSEDSRGFVKEFSSNRMNVNSYNGLSQQSANLAAQQKIADGIKDNGLGDGAGMIFGMNMANNLGPNSEIKHTQSLDEQIAAVKKLKSLVDEGILSEDEFNLKKKEIMGL